MSGNVALDPYFMQAYQWNPQAYMWNQQVPAQQQVQQTQSVPADSTAATKSKEEKSSHTGLTLAAIGTTALAALACYKGKGNPIKGAKNIWNACKNKLPKAEKFMMTKNEAGEWVCKLPNKKNTIRRDNLEVLEKLGSNTNIPEVIADGKLAKGIKLHDYTFTHDGNTFRVIKGKVYKATNAAGEKFALDASAVDYQKTVKELVAKYNRGENFSDLSNVTFLHSDNGITRLFKNGEFKGAVTDRFHINQKEVEAFRTYNPKADEVIKSFLEKGQSEKLKVVEAMYPTAAGKIHIKNNQIAGVYNSAGTYCPINSTEYGSIVFNNKEIFDNVFKNTDSFTNQIYAMVV